MSQRKINAFFSQREQEQPIRDCNCREVMAVCEVSSSVLEDARIDSAENFMAIKGSKDSTNVNKSSTRSSECICSCCENFEVAHHPTDLSESKSFNSSCCIY